MSVCIRRSSSVLRYHRAVLPARAVARQISTSPTNAPQPEKSHPRTPVPSQETTSKGPKLPPQQEKNWLTKYLETSPTAKKTFLSLVGLFGYDTPRQGATFRTFHFYRDVCALPPDENGEFWQGDCRLPPTFQSWFTITNLHVWMMTVRLRALPEPYGKHYVAGLVDHFFLDVEDRVRAVLQPPDKPQEPYTFETSFYVNPNAPGAKAVEARMPDGKVKPRGKAPERLVTQQLKIFKEQWAGMGMSFDLGMVQGDMEMAAAVWRNFLGARGAQGIVFPEDNPTSVERRFRRTVNLVGGEVVNVSKINVESEEAKDDGSGIHDFAPEDADLYLEYPQLMLDIVTYVRRELVRLQNIPDREFIQGTYSNLKFGHVRT